MPGECNSFKLLTPGGQKAAATGSLAIWSTDPRLSCPVVRAGSRSQLTAGQTRFDRPTNSPLFIHRGEIRASFGIAIPCVLKRPIIHHLSRIHRPMVNYSLLRRRQRTALLQDTDGLALAACQTSDRFIHHAVPNPGEKILSQPLTRTEGRSPTTAFALEVLRRPELPLP
jgi:hypothetical protein